ncbi:MAG TPA: DUF881 domain-containing protein [Nocardioidaceae bacterium]|nr:DUF881 domain-containing protein [Nocardioidaceae bacterium]
MPELSTQAPPAPPTGRSRLLDGLLGRPSRGQVIVAVLVMLLGFAAAVQMHITHTSNDFAGQRRQDLVDLLDSLSSAADRADAQISELQRTRSKLQSQSRAKAAALAEDRRRLQVLGILAGTLPATGPGVIVTIDDPRGTVSAAAILNGIEELRDAGAEAIQINHRVRVVASTYVTDGDGGIIVDGHQLAPPYVIDAIGSAHTLGQAVVFPGGLSDDVSALGGKVSVQQAGKVVVSALHRAVTPEYAQPTGS